MMDMVESVDLTGCVGVKDMAGCEHELTEKSGGKLKVKYQRAAPALAQMRAGMTIVSTSSSKFKAL